MAQAAAEISDAELLTSVRRGDTAAFRALMVRHLSAVSAAARRIVRDDAEAEDIAQETFLKLWHGASTLETIDGGIGAWLRRVAANQAIDRLRKANRLDVTDEPPEQSVPPDQEASMSERQTADRVEAVIHSLPERQRIAITLFHFEDLSQREVAAMMQISEDALESLLARARRRLRDLLRDDWRELIAPEVGPV